MSDGVSIPVETDPVCGMKVDPAKALSATRDGKTFHFCGESCRKKFLASPSEAKPEPKVSEPVKAGNAVYTCPMHPEVQQDHPGNCPKCGMNLELKSGKAASGENENAELADMTRRFWIGGALALPVFVLSMAHMVPGLSGTWVEGNASRWIQFALATPVVWWAGWPFFQRAWRSILTMNLNMFTLIGIGVGASYASSAVAMLAPGLFPRTGNGGAPDIYFEASAVIVVLVLLGQVLELRARNRTGSAIKALLDLAPPTARKAAQKAYSPSFSSLLGVTL